VRPSFFHHLHPPTIPAAQARLRYTLGAGGLAVYLTLVVGFSGMLEMFYYVPTPAEAPLSIQQITFLVPFGWLVRNLHYWSAQLLVLVAGAHLLRVAFTGAYAPPRRFNYLLGLALFVLILFLDFSGYVLRWDASIRWALVAGTNLVAGFPWIGPWLYGALVGGGQPGPATLTRFFNWHIFGLALAMVVVGIWHAFRVRRDGGIAVPPPEMRRDPRRITRFELARREGVAALLATAILLLMATFLPAPLAAPIQNGNMLSAEASAPWFFLWVQQLLKWGNPFFFGVVVPFLILLLLASLPYIFPAPRPEHLGRWFPPSARPVQVIVALVTLGILGLTLAAWLS
jgi:quinol-cytochrome oxidoreductase complex cytochrome b subunit